MTSKFLRFPTFFWALVSGLLLWAAFPPLGFWPLAWLAPVGWLLLVRRQSLLGKHPYLAIWLAGWFHWAAMLQGIRLAHPVLYWGWLSLSAYLAIYPAVFVGLTRIAVHRAHVPLLAAAPLVWTGLEWFRGHALTGFSLALLGHTQIHWTGIIQVADLAGAYAVSFVVMFVAAALAESLDGRLSRATRRHRLMAAAVLVLVVQCYGFGRIQASRSIAADGKPALRVALIQGSFDTVFEADPERDADVFSRYLELSLQAVREAPEVDLVVWPESAFTGTLGDVVADPPWRPPPETGLSAEQFQRSVRAWEEAFQQKTDYVTRRLNEVAAKGQTVSLIVGCDTQRLSGGRMERLNSALLIAPSGQVRARYFKEHLVMFGEYLPFGEWFPGLYDLTPMASGLTPGVGPKAFRVGSVILSPSICFESTVPHLIRRQVVDLQRAGTPPDMLVNVTNDGWFWGSSILDLHLACNVFRAVENRLPLVIAANTGISAHIDANGRIDQRGGRREEAILHATVQPGAQISKYHLWGDSFSLICILFCFAMSIIGIRDRILGGKRAKTKE